MPDVVFQCEKGADGKIYWTFNEGRLAEEFHLTTKEVQGRPLETLFPPEVAQRLLAEFERAFQGEAREFTNELGGRHFRHFPQPVRDAQGRVISVVGFITEVTSLVRAEQEIARLNLELSNRVDALAAANEELDAFAHTVAHDLRTPLTIIGAGVGALHGEAAPAVQRRALQLIDSSQRRMGRLIDDLLRFAGAGRQPVRPERVDLGPMARAIAAEFDHLDAKRQVDWTIGKVPGVQGDPALLRLLLENLMGNAWKFTGLRAAAHVEFGAERVGDEIWFYVRDNGIGFDPDEADRVFEPFHRLAEGSKFSGTGVGLATVKRIVERHGGRVWAMGRPREGATFYFTLPGPLKVPAAAYAAAEPSAVA